MEWLQDGTKLLVSGNAKQGEGGRAIWLISTVTGTLRVLRDNAWGAAISPDNSLIAFRNSARAEIWLMGLNGENPRKFLSAPKGHMFERLAWSPHGLRLAYIKSTLGLDTVVIESIAVGGGEPVPMLDDQRIIDFCWVPDGRILVSRSELPPNEYDSNLWEFRADSGSGQRDGELRRVTNWAGFNFRDISLSGNGKRMAFASNRAHSDVYLGDLKAGGAQLASHRRFTMDERIDWPGGWTHDGKLLFISDRNGNLDVYRQAIDAPAPEPVVSGPEDKRSPQMSPDGNWILFLAWPKTGCCVSAPVGKLMRARASGGSPEPVFDVKGYPGSAQVPRLRESLSARGNPDFRCPSRPAAPCVLAEQEGDQVIFTAFDPVKGRGAELARFHATERSVAWDLSPDGERIAVSQLETARGIITIIPLSGGARQEIPLKGWARLSSLGWSPGGDSIYACNFTTSVSSMFHVSLKGDVQVVYQTTGSAERPLVSPDGRRLAFGGRIVNSNAWVIENF
jgi:Tol biopolymer transport system component